MKTHLLTQQNDQNLDQCVCLDTVKKPGRSAIEKIEK